MGKSYYLGLDLGTSSCGWAVTDENYNLLRAKGKDLWGVRLFPEAQTAAERRIHRTARRRLQREKARKGYLRELFGDAINKVDSAFYQRLDDSKYMMEDKTIQQPYALFADTGYTDQDYHHDYPTIFHLRKELIQSDKPHDVRLVYLAVENILKHRGHFLNANLGEDGVDKFENIYYKLHEKVKEVLEIDLKEHTVTELEKILTSKDDSNTRKFEKLIKKFDIQKSKMKAETEMIKLICGLSGSIVKIFKEAETDEEMKKMKVSFRETDLDEKISKIAEVLQSESYELFMLLKQLHDSAVLQNIMQGENGTYAYLSFAKVDSYNKHKKDLKIFKNTFKKYKPDQYNKMFRSEEKNSYSAYIGSVKCKEKRQVKKCVRDDFYKNVQKQVKNMPKDADTEYILEEIEKENFLPKQLTPSNGVIPNQLHKSELKKILQNAEKYLEFLSERDETGLSVSEKILKLFEFQIPYYVGPLSSQKGTGWAVRKESGKVLPWNFEQKIDVRKSAEKFIDRAVKHCTYLNDEKVLPQNSLLYEKFRVLNELNNLKINGERISVQLKQRLYQDLFRKGKRVTRKKIAEILYQNGIICEEEKEQVTGVDHILANTLANHKKFAEIFNVDVMTYQQEQMAEKIIFWATVYGDSKKFLKEKIKEAYSGELTEQQVKRILGMKFRDWGRLSKAFLELEGADKETGEIQTIIERMWNGNYNLMELLSNKFTYLETLEEKTKKIEKSLLEIEYDDLEDLYIYAPVRRMIWQTILLLKEICRVMGNEPKRIFIEMARDTGAKKERTISRKKKFQELYKQCKKESREWLDEINDISEAEFRKKKLYLYYTQKGRCMYTGEEIDIRDLFVDNLYDIDHIYPRHFVKDDSIENNLVLVKKEKNLHKSDHFPIEESIRKKNREWWNYLKNYGFITEEKYKRLTRTNEFTDEELANFISRQIVETRQGTKTIAQLLRQAMPESEIVYTKAGNVSQFRQKFDMIKCRYVNDFHHAQDAYLNIVVGNVYFIKFTKSPINFIKEYKKNPKVNAYHMYKIFEYDICRNGETAWVSHKGKSIAVVKAVMRKNTPIITFMNYEKHGAIADQNLYSASAAKKAKGVNYLAAKTSDKKIQDLTKYGGYNKIAGAYFFLVEHTVKKKRIRSIETMPIYLKDTIDSVEKMEEYCRSILGYQNPQVRMKKIKIYSLLKVDGFYLYLTGRTNNSLFVCNAVQLVLKYEYCLYVKRIIEAYGNDVDENLLEKRKDISKEKNMELYNQLTEKHNCGIYRKRPNPVGEKLKEGVKKFEKLTLKEQIYVLQQILQLSLLLNRGADLRSIGEKKTTGVSSLNKKISEKKEFKLINQSITGLYENEIDLLTI